MARRSGPDQGAGDDAPTPPDRRARPARRRDFGDGSVYQRKDGRWVAQIVTQETPRRFRRLSAPRDNNTRQAALKLLDQLKADLRDDIDAVGGRMVLERWLDYYLVTVVHVEEKAQNTRDDLRYLCEKIIAPELAALRLSAITHERLEAWRDRMRERYADSVVKRACQLLKRALGEAHARGTIRRNPAHTLPSFEAATTSAATLSRTHADALLKVAPRYGCGIAVACALALGLRIGEALGLRWEDYDPILQVMRVERQVLDDAARTLAEPKRGSRRELPVPPDLAARLMDWRAKVGGVGFIAPAETGRPLSHGNARRALRQMLAAAALPEGLVTWHGLRHTLGLRLTELGTSEAIMGKILGHKGGSVTRRYTHAEVEALRPWVVAAERHGAPQSGRRSA